MMIWLMEGRRCEMKEIIPHMRAPWDNGSGPDYWSPYRDLATGVVQLAVKDYKKTLGPYGGIRSQKPKGES